MPYTLFDPSKPDAAVDNGTAFGSNTRNNLLAMRDAVALGVMPGFNFSVAGGTASQPATMFFTKGTEILRATLTWGTVGGAAGNVTVAVYAYSANGGATYSTIGTETLTYSASANLTSTTWS